MNTQPITMKAIVFPILFTVSIATVVKGQEPKLEIDPGQRLLKETENTSIKPGTTIGDFSFRDLNGNPYFLSQSVKQGPTAFVFMSTTCPLAKRYTERLKRLHKAFSEKGVSLFAVFPNDYETKTEIRNYLKQAEFTFPMVHDVAGYITSRLGATMTPQAFLVDSSMKLRYRGAIDDNRYSNRVQTSFLNSAIASVLNNEEVAVKEEPASGCNISLPKVEKVTYSGHIARILQENCMSCHRKGQVAPFPLTNYEEAVDRQTLIQEYTKARLMPPWKASPGFVHYKNDISLKQSEIDLIDKWVKQGAPLGNKNEIPPAPKFNEGWAFGEPDMIVEMEQDFTIPPEGEDIYQHFVIKNEDLKKLTKNRFIRAVDVKPGNKKVVHHVLAYANIPAKEDSRIGQFLKAEGEKAGKDYQGKMARYLDDESPDIYGYTRFGGLGFEPALPLGGWAPGNQPEQTPKGTGRFLPQNADIILQVHYYRTGVKEKDRTKIGLYFEKSPQPVAARTGVVINQKFTIPAGKKDYLVTVPSTDPNPNKSVPKFTLGNDAYLYSVTPHMHLLGKTMTVVAKRPDGTTENIAKIDDWDFKWQTTYYFQKPYPYLPKGTTVELKATFDNSKENPNNPNNPPKPVGWGERTTDEMCIAFLGYVRKAEYDALTKKKEP